MPNDERPEVVLNPLEMTPEQYAYIKMQVDVMSKRLLHAEDRLRFYTEGLNRKNQTREEEQRYRELCEIAREEIKLLTTQRHRWAKALGLEDRYPILDG